LRDAAGPPGVGARLANLRIDSNSFLTFVFIRVNSWIQLSDEALDLSEVVHSRVLPGGERGHLPTNPNPLGALRHSNFFLSLLLSRLY
jgi:hypothetical protein